MAGIDAFYRSALNESILNNYSLLNNIKPQPLKTQFPYSDLVPAKVLQIKKTVESKQYVAARAVGGATPTKIHVYF